MNKHAAILSVGDELLSGQTINTNASWISAELFKKGIEVERAVTIGDNVKKIADEIKELSKAFCYVFVVGGIGPTPDDKTRYGVAKGLGLKLLENKKAKEMVYSYYRNISNPFCNRMALIPKGAKVLCNKMGAAPAFKVKNVYVLPGVPYEMKAIFNKIKRKFKGRMIYEECIRTRLGESVISEYLEKCERKYPAVKIGSYPSRKKNGVYIVKIVLKSKDKVKIGKAKSCIVQSINNAE